MVEKRIVSDHFWSFLIGLLIGTTTGVFSGVVLVAVLHDVKLFEVLVGPPMGAGAVMHHGFGEQLVAITSQGLDVDGGGDAGHLCLPGSPCTPAPRQTSPRPPP